MSSILTVESTEFHADLESHHAPVRPSRQSSSRAPTPRPSISPLSTASKPNRSPELTRDILMSGTTLLEEAELEKEAAAENGDFADDRSSSLSEPGDDDDEVEEPPNAATEALAQEQAAVQLLLEDDSEAETERLDVTPQKAQKHIEDVGRTPSKLGQAVTMEDELSDPPSPLPLGTGAASSTSTVGVMDKKRKRSASDESPLTSPEPDLEESPRKRSHEMHAEAEEEHEADVEQSKAEETTQLEKAERNAPLQPASLPATKGKKGKPRGRKPKELVTESEAEQQEDVAELEAELSEEAIAKKEEDKQARADASTNLQALAKHFTGFREALYNERIASTNAELRMLENPDCQHPEYLAQVACVDARREKQMREAQAFYHYRLTSIRQRTIGERAQLHSQYFQCIRDMREDHLYSLGEDWYNIQKERRDQHQAKDEDHIYKFPAKKSEQIQRQAQYNQEISVLSGVAKYVGFPAAPEIKGAEGASLDDDLKAMKISKRVSQTNTAPAQTQPFYQRLPTVPTQNERLAHEQFIEQNAWAQPQRPIHNHSTPGGLTHTPDWVDQPGQHSSARNLIRNLSGQVPQRQGTGSPYATPMPRKQGLPVGAEHSSSAGTIPANNSDGLEPPSSVQAAPPTGERIQQFHHHHQIGTGSPRASPLHVHKQRVQKGAGSGLERERDRDQQVHHQQQHKDEAVGERRNISNISALSGASTIDAPTTESPENARERDWRENPGSGASKFLSGNFGFRPDPTSIEQQQQHHQHQQGQRGMSMLPHQRSEGAFGTPAPLNHGGPGLMAVPSPTPAPPAAS
ncbi:Transcriptional regulatory protein [Recurvomyces mirabilis]|nr:Transcriptional regulatory protein [Recurvomyces mirabilis]